MEYYYNRTEILQAGISHQTFYTWQEKGLVPYIQLLKKGKRFAVYKSQFEHKELKKLFKILKEQNGHKRGRRVAQLTTA